MADPGGQNVAARFSPTCTLQYGQGQATIILCSSVHEAWGVITIALLTDS